MERTKIGVIGDDETLSGFMIAGVRSSLEDPVLISVSSHTSDQDLKSWFIKLTHRADIAILFICDFVADKIRDDLNKYKQLLPSILEIGSKNIYK